MSHRGRITGAGWTAAGLVAVFLLLTSWEVELDGEGKALEKYGIMQDMC